MGSPTASAFYDPEWLLTTQLLGRGRVSSANTSRSAKPSGGKSFRRPWNSGRNIRRSVQHVDQALGGLKPGVFYRLESVESHLAFGEHNPLNTGQTPDQVAVFRSNSGYHRSNEEREEAGKQLIHRFVHRRLIPLGCVLAAIDEENKLCIAREPRLDALFRPDGRPGGAGPS